VGQGFFIWGGFCLCCFIYRTVFNMLLFRRHPWAEKKGPIILVYPAMAGLWFSWFQMNFADPLRRPFPLGLRIGGFAVFSGGVFLVVFSMIKLHGVEHRGRLVTSGIFSKIRNPMYLGFILWTVGLPLGAQSPLTLASAPLWIFFLVFWKILEEKDLLGKYEGYREYMRRTWF
jgi:protein-S-isoprenylcysteine O-methyltransferase Ste14